MYPARSSDTESGTGSATGTGNATDWCAVVRLYTSGWCTGIEAGNRTAADAAADKALGEIGVLDPGCSARRRIASVCPGRTGVANTTRVLYYWAGRIGVADLKVWTWTWTVIVTEIEIETEAGGVSCQDQNYCRVLPSNLALSHRSDPTPISTIPTWH